LRIYAKKVNESFDISIPSKLENTFQTVKHSTITHTTIKSYLDMLQDVFLIERSVRYDIKGRK